MADTSLDILKEIRDRLGDLPEKLAARLSGNSPSLPSGMSHKMPTATLPVSLPSPPMPAAPSPAVQQAVSVSQPPQSAKPTPTQTGLASVAKPLPVYTPPQQPVVPAMPYKASDASGIRQAPPHIRAKFGSAGGAVPRQLRGKQPHDQAPASYPASAFGGTGGQGAAGGGGAPGGREAVQFLRRIADAMDDMLKKMEKPAQGQQRQIGMQRQQQQSQGTFAEPERTYTQGSPSVRVSVLPTGARGGGARIPQGRRA